ncbi:MAG: hypothetical protein ACR2GU_14015 [Rubrobacteraceae bacterium]
MTEDRKIGDIREMEVRLAELERLADELGSVQEEEMVESLDRAVGLLGEINNSIEVGLRSASDGERELGEVLGSMDFGPFDEALEELERQERNPGEHGP